MKLYNKITSILICSLVLLSSCDDWDFDSDSSYDGLFRTPKIEAKEIEATYIDLLWNKVPNADYYKIELSEDSLKFETNLKEVGAGEVIAKNEYTIADLVGSTRYSVRIKALSNAGIKESEWATYTFKTKSEQILDDVSALGSSSATLTWDSKSKVDSYVLYEGGSTTGTKHALTEAEIAEGKLVLTGLKEATQYRVVVLLGTITRGSRTFTTTENFPEGYTIVTLAEGDDLDAVLAAQSGNIVLVLPSGGDIVRTEALTIPDAISSLIFWGASGGEKAKFYPKTIIGLGTFDMIRFYNLTIYNGGPGDDYIINQDKVSTINTISIENCDVKDSRGVIRYKDAGGKASILKNIEITNCTFTNIGSYGVINTKDITALGTENIKISKSTFNTVKAGALLNVHQNNVNVVIDQCTFFNCVQTGKPYIDVNKLTTITPTVNNSLFGKSNEYVDGNKVRAASIKGIVSAENVYYTSDCVWDSGYNIGTLHSKTSEDLFEDPTNGIFRIKDPSFTAKTGDPRWLE